MDAYPTRKEIRIEGYDYAATGAYFITVCVAGRKPILWNVGAIKDRPRANAVRPYDNEPNTVGVPLSGIGAIVDAEMKKLNTVYDAVRVDTYCVMPDHVHMILSIHTDADGRPQVAPTVSRVMKQFKGSVTKQVGRPIWQRSFYEHVIRNPQDYDEIWKYIENNPLTYVVKQAP